MNVDVQPERRAEFSLLYEIARGEQQTVARQEKPNHKA